MGIILPLAGGNPRRSSLSRLALVTPRIKHEGESFLLIIFSVRRESLWRRALLELRLLLLIELFRPKSQECEFSLLLNGFTTGPFYPFLTYTPLLAWRQEDNGEGGNKQQLHQIFSNARLTTVQRHLLYTIISKQQQRRSVQLVQVKSKNSPHPGVAMRPSRRQHRCGTQGVAGQHWRGCKRQLQTAYGGAPCCFSEPICC